MGCQALKRKMIVHDAEVNYMVVFENGRCKRPMPGVEYRPHSAIP